MVDNRLLSWLPFLIVVFALAAGTMGATMASPLYPLYERAWGLAHSTTTIIYVVYMVGVMVAFLFLGRLPALIGPVTVLRTALGLLLCGLVLCALAGGVVLLGTARGLVGIASGMITTSATIALLQLEPGGPRHASLITSMTTMAGFGLGPFVSGLIAQFAPAPLVTPYLVIVLPLAAIMIGLMRLPGSHPAPPASALSFMPRLAVPDAQARPGFLLVSLAVFSAYALFSLLASLAPSFLQALLPWHGPAVSGTAVAAVLFCSALVQFPARSLSPRRCLAVSLMAMTAGTVLLAWVMLGGSSILFAVADVSIGIGHGLAFMAGLSIVNRIARAEHHAGILATFFSIGYLGTIAPILAVGYLADHIGLSAATVAFCASFAIFCSLLLCLTPRYLRLDKISKPDLSA